MSAALIARLIEAGTPAALVGEVAMELARASAALETLNNRRAKDRNRKRNVSTESAEPLESAESAEMVHPPLSPPKVSPDPFKITPPIPPRSTTERAKRLPEDWVPEPLTGKALAMVQRWNPGELEREIAKFKNYWLGKGGKDACKTDWQRTFINWLMSADERKPNHDRTNQHHPNLGKTSAAIIGLGGVYDERPM